MKSNTIYGWLFVIAFVFSMYYKPVFCFLLIGTLSVFYVIHYALFLNKIKKHGKEVIGKILSYETDHKGYKIPLVEFEVNEQIISKKPYYYSSTDLSKIKSYKQNINKSFPILYDPNNPEKFIIKSEKGFNYFSLTLFGIAGIIFILIGIAQLFNLINIDGL